MDAEAKLVRWWLHLSELVSDVQHHDAVEYHAGNALSRIGKAELIKDR